MIYPQCQNGTMIPFVSSSGYLFPCCKIIYNKKIYDIDNVKVENPFISPNFSLYKKTYGEIVESNEWIDFIDSLTNTKIQKCHAHCGHSHKPIMSIAEEFDPNVEYTNIKIKTKDLRHIQLEFTNRCNLVCRYCSRQNYASKDIDLNRYDLPISVVEDILSYHHWINVIDCPTFSDSIFYKHYHEVLDIMKYCMIDHYKLSTAATGRTKSWWAKTQELWKELNASQTKVIIFWGIDGLEDTSKIHRVNQDWEEITSNMKIAAKNGIECNWQYIPMKFNEHQIEEAKRMAEDWGVNFFLRASERFRKNDPWIPTNPDYYFDIEYVNHKPVIKNNPVYKITRNK